MLYKLKKASTLLAMLGLAALFLAACGSQPTPATTPAAPTATIARPTTAPTTAPTPPPTAQAVPTTVVQQYTFKPFMSADGGFSVLMPGEPMPKKQTVVTPVGLLDLHIFTVELDNDTTAYLATYVDYPEDVVKGNADSVLSNVRDGQLEGQRGRLLSERFVALGQYPGRELEIETANNYVRGRIYLVGTRLYQILAVYPFDQRPTADSRQFLDSFRLSN